MKHPLHSLWMKSHSPSKRPEVQAKIRAATIRQWKNPKFRAGMTGENNSSKRLEVRLKISINNLGKNLGKVYPHMHGNNNPMKCPNQIQRMKSGGASHALSFNKSPSKPQLQLYNLTKSILLGVKLNYPCKNYSIDIAIPCQKIAIEYDGSYWHQDEKKDNKRQQNLEKEGWKFIRYRDYLPTKGELLKSIINLG